MQPADTALTRMYNQPVQKLPNGRTVGLLYRNPIDCLWKTLKTEGPLGWYKGRINVPLALSAQGSLGTTAHFLRIAPHTIITLTAYDLIINAYRSFW